MSEPKTLGHLSSGEPVVDRHNSHLHAEVANLIPKALAQLTANGRRFFTEEVDFGRPIGETICVATVPGDAIIYAQRPRRLGLSRFVKNRQQESCNSLVVVLKKAEDGGYYVCISAFVGYRPEPEPWDERNFAGQRNPAMARECALAFWTTHALIWGAEEVVPGTETANCPW